MSGWSDLVPAGYVSSMQALLLTANLAQAEHLVRECDQLPNRVSLDAVDTLQAAIGRLSLSGTDVIILDLVHPPVGAAADLVATSRSRFPSIPIVVIVSDAAAAAESLVAGAQAFALSSAEVPQAIVRVRREASTRPSPRSWKVLYITRGEPMRDSSPGGRVQLEIVTGSADAEPLPAVAADASAFDAVVVDLSDDATDLLPLLQDVVSRHADVPVLAITDAGNRRLATAAIQLGAVHVVGKMGAWPVRLAHAIDQAALARRARLDAALVRTNESRLRALVEALPTGVSVIAPDGSILAMNAAALASIGVNRPEEVVRTNVMEHLEGSDREAMEGLVAIVSDGRPHRVDVRWRTPDGFRRLEISGAPLDRAGEGRAVLASIRDVGEDHAAAAAAERQRAAAAHGLLASLKDEHEAQSRQVAALSKDLEATRARLADLEVERVSWRAQADTEIGAMRSALAGEAERAMLVERLQREVATLRDALSDAVREADAVRAAGIAHAQAEIDQLKRVLHDFQVERAREAEVHGRELERLHALTATHGRVQAELETARATLEQAREEQADITARARRQVEEMQAELSRAREAQAQEADARAREIEALRQAQVTREREASGATQQFEQQLAATRQAAEATRATLESQVSAMQLDLDAAEQLLAEREDQRQAALTVLADRDAQLRVVQELLESHEAELRAARQLARERETELRHIEQLASEGDTRLRASDARVASLESQVAAAEALIAHRDARLAEAEQAIREQERRLASAADSAAYDERVLVKARTALEVRDATIAELRSAFDTREAELSVQAAELNALRDQLAAESDARRAAVQLAVEKDRDLLDARTRLLAREADLSTAVAELAQVRQRLANRDVEVATSTTQLGEATKRIAALAQQLHVAEQARDAMLAQLSAAADELARTQQWNAGLRVRVQEAEAARDAALERAGTAEGELSRRVTGLESLLRAAERLATDRERARAELAEALDTREASLEGLQAELVVLRRQLADLDEQAQAAEQARNAVLTEAAAMSREAQQRIAAFEARERERRGTDAVGRVAADFVREVDALVADVSAALSSTSPGVAEHDPQLSAMRAAVRRVERARTITQQFLAFSRSRLRGVGPTAVADVVSGVAPMVEQLAGEDVRVTIAPIPAALEVIAPRDALARTLLALVGAAVEALPVGGGIAIDVEGPRTLAAIETPVTTLVVRVNGFGRLPLRAPASFQPALSSWGATLGVAQDEEGQRYELALPSAD